MHAVDYSLIFIYLAALVVLGMRRRLRADSDAAEIILAGRRLTMPAFVASLVSTWYGGILGVGEFSFSYGLSNWLVFGLPYYVAAIIFAVFLARKARRTELLTIPEQLAKVYDNRAAAAGTVIVFLLAVPASYVLMLGVLCQYLFGIPFWLGVLAGTLFSIVYIYVGGFQSVVRTDLLQFALMFAGFAVLFILLVFEYGGLTFLRSHLPALHLTWHGGNSVFYIAAWYVVALEFLIQPAVYQRCFAARSESVARTGIFVSVGFWLVFDFLTTSCGLYARAILPDLADPLASYPALAQEVLPVGLLGLFSLSLLATVMSTIDSYSFVAASTFGQDIMLRLLGRPSSQVALYTRVGLVLSTLLAVGLAVFFRSAVELWYLFGSVATPALLVPVFSSFVGKRRLSPTGAWWCMLASGGLSLFWYLSKYFSGSGDYIWSFQPVFPGLIVSLVIYVIWARSGATPVAKPV